ncbi:MAG: hypothetical protein IIC71_09700 [Acidobacteria bacterium]|nr:hypothetical protein [Acidobacteriota bacterium]
MDTIIYVSIGEPYAYWSERALKSIESVYEPHGDGAFGCTLVGLLTLSGSRAAFSDTTSNTNNSLGTGTVTLTGDDTGLAMFAVTDMAPRLAIVRLL